MWRKVAVSTRPAPAVRTCSTASARLSPVSVMSSTMRTRSPRTGPESPSLSEATPSGVAVTPQCCARIETTRFTPRRSESSRAGTHPPRVSPTSVSGMRRAERTCSASRSAQRSTSDHVARRQRGRSTIRSALGVDAADPNRVHDPLYGHDVGGGSVVDFALGRDLVDRLVGVDHHALQPVVDLAEGPEVPLDVLRPLEVADGDAARVREDVGQHGDLLLEEDLVRLGERGAVRGLGNDLRLHLVRILGRQYVLEGGRHEDVRLRLEDLFVGDRLRAGEPDDGAGLLLVRLDGVRVEPVRLPDAALGVRDGDDLRALLVVEDVGG